MATTEEVKDYFKQMASMHQQLQQVDDNNMNKHSIVYDETSSSNNNFSFQLKTNAKAPGEVVECLSDCINQQNTKRFDENDDDPTGPLLLQINDKPGSLVARLELALLLKTATTCYDAYHTVSHEVIY